MKYSVSVLVLALVAVVIVACEQEKAGREPREVRPGKVSQSTHNPQPGKGPQQGSQTSRDSQAGDQPEANQGANIDEEPLLLVDDEPLLLLDGGEEESLPPTGPVADNSRCQHCHLDYVQEELAVVHARANIGCADCHGDCDAHIADESWAWGGNGTPPEIMYPREKINPCCLGCHAKEKIDTEEHKPLFAGTAEEKYCTDCHGDHRLTERKCKWK